MNVYKIHAKLFAVASVFCALVTCQSMMLSHLASAEPESQPTKECQKVEQPPWVDEEPSASPCPVYGSKSS